MRDNSYQLAYLFAAFISLGIHVAKHGQKREYNAYAYSFDFLFTMFLLYKGGFFDNM